MLVDLTELKVYLQITGTESDAILTLFAEMAQAELETIIDRSLVSATATDEVLMWEVSKFDQRPTREIDTYQPYNQYTLENNPVVAFQSLTYNGETIDSSKYEVDLKAGIVRTYYYFPALIPGALKATYTYGYTADTLPADLQMVLYEGIKGYYQDNTTASRGSREASSKRLGDFSVTYKDDAVDISEGSGGSGFANYMKRYLANNYALLRRYMRVNL